jgi:hypothetical protein
MEQGQPLLDSRLVAEAMVTLVFNQGAEALDGTSRDRETLSDHLKTQLRMILVGARELAKDGSSDT